MAPQLSDFGQGEVHLVGVVLMLYGIVGALYSTLPPIMLS